MPDLERGAQPVADLAPLLRDLIADVLPHFGLEHLGEEAITGRDRHRTHADARSVCMWVARKRMTLSYPELGRCFNRDQSTVMHNCEKVESCIATDPEGKIAIAALSVVVSFQPDRFERGRLHTGARELNFGAMPIVKIETDEGRILLGSAHSAAGVVA